MNHWMVELGLCSQLKYKEKKVGSSNDETVGDRCGLTEETEDNENWQRKLIRQIQKVS